MQKLLCRCGRLAFCDNTLCDHCGRVLGFDPFSNRLLSLDQREDGTLVSESGEYFQFCDNREKYGVCNGLVAATENTPAETRCRSCALNRTIPNLRRKRNILLWSRLERAKRRLLSGLTALGLDPSAPTSRGIEQIRFDFLEDSRSHPDVLESFVSTGHKDGVITINVLEADDIQRMRQRQLMGERYRTVLGHFRHEAGHFFYSRLVIEPGEFRRLFGDPNEDYDTSVSGYYDNGPPPDWNNAFISAYACSHPLEDWAESFAHYLHIQDGLETAATCGRLKAVSNSSFRDQLEAWISLSLDMNEINRSLGVRDPYPFVITATIADKLAFVAACVEKAQGERA